MQLPAVPLCTSPPAGPPQGVLDLLLSNAPVARQLCSSFTVLLLPMLNPDGVAAGNTRGSLAGGQDLNRIWGCPSRLLHPEVRAPELAGHAALLGASARCSAACMSVL